MISERLLAYPALPERVVKEGEFPFAAVGLSHGHIYGMCEGLMEAGATLSWVYEENEALLAAFHRRYPHVRVARCLDEILEDQAVKMVASAAIPSERCPIGLRVMASGKDFFADKAPFVTLEALESARRAVKETGKKYAVFFSERCANESAVYAGYLIERGAIGRPVNVIGMGPHKLHNGETRGEWFYRRETSGGILIDIGSHQIEQFLYYTGNESAQISSARIANYAHAEHPEFDDFGDCSLVGENGASGYFRVDWFTPTPFPAFGDGRTVIVGTEGTIELRKYHDPATGQSDLVILSNKDGTECRSVRGKVGLPFFGQLIRDCLDRTETAMSARHAFTAAELCIRAQEAAIDLTSRRTVKK